MFYFFLVLVGMAGVGIYVLFIFNLVPGAQAGNDVAVVVHPDVAVDNLSTSELRRLVLGDRGFWPGSQRITLLIRAPVAHERDIVVKKICEMTEAQFRQHWIAKVFRADMASAPKIVYSSEMAVDLVNRIPGAIAVDGTYSRPESVCKSANVFLASGAAPLSPYTYPRWPETSGLPSDSVTACVSSAMASLSMLWCAYEAPRPQRADTYLGSISSVRRN